MTNLDDRIAAHPVAAATRRRSMAIWDWNDTGGSPTQVQECNDAEAALIAVLDAEDRARAEMLADLRDIHLQVVTGAFDRSELELMIYALIKRLEG